MLVVVFASYAMLTPFRLLCAVRLDMTLKNVSSVVRCFLSNNCAVSSDEFVNIEFMQN